MFICPFFCYLSLADDLWDLNLAVCFCADGINKTNASLRVVVKQK